MKDQLDINPQTKVGEMLDIYPQLEDVLIELSPIFVKLKNPILRKTVARAVSLRQAAEIGGVKIGEMISKLRNAVNLGQIDNISNVEFEMPVSPPYWLLPDIIRITFNVTDIIERGDSPMKKILEKTRQLDNDNIMELITPFIPIPIIEYLTSNGYLCWSKKDGDKVYTYIKKK